MRCRSETMPDATDKLLDEIEAEAKDTKRGPLWHPVYVHPDVTVALVAVARAALKAKMAEAVGTDLDEDIGWSDAIAALDSLAEGKT